MINFRKCALPATLIFALTLLFSYTPSQNAHAESGEGQVYTITTDPTYPPFEFQEEGEYIGIDIELMDAIAEDQGFEYRWDILPFSGGLQALETNQVDGMIAALSITEERELSFDFSDPYYEAGIAMAVVAGDDSISGYEDLEGQTVAAKTGTTGAALVSDLQDSGIDVRLTLFEDSASMYADVISGNAVAAFDDAPVMEYAIAQGINLDLPTEPEPGDSYAFAVNKDQNPELLEMFNEGLANIQENGVYDEIVDRYTSAEASEVGSHTILGLVSNYYPDLLDGLWNTFLLTIISFALSLAAGTIFGLFSVAPNKLLNGVSRIYVDIMRGIPLIVLAFFTYFSIPAFFSIDISAVTAGILTISLNTTAYISEQVRGGILAVNKGQLEAARSLGLDYNRSMRKVILPQAIKIMIPSLINQFVITLKDTSILSVIGIVELTQTGKIVIASTYASGNMWLIIGVMYIIIITILTRISNAVERRLMANG